MRLPKNYNGVTIGQYQEIHKVWNSMMDELDKWVHIICILTDKQVDEVEDWPIQKLTASINKIKWIVKGEFYQSKHKYILVKGRPYKAIMEAKDANVARYIEIKTFLERGSFIEQLHSLCASIYTPLTLNGWVNDSESHKYRADLFKNVPIGKVYPVVFFYSVQLKNKIKNMQESGIKKLNKDLRKVDQDLMQTLREILNEAGVGTLSLMKSQEGTH